MKVLKKLWLAGILIILGCPSAIASHNVGSIFNYEYLGEGAWPNSKLFRFTIVSYQECSVLNVSSNIVYINSLDSIDINRRFFINQPTFPFEVNEVSCSLRPSSSEGCFKQIVITDTISIKEERLPYGFIYNNCCLNANIDNVPIPDSMGSSNVLEINPYAYEVSNNSPKFFNTKKLNICANESFHFQTEIEENDGDQLIFKLCSPLGRRRINMDDLSLPFPPIPYIFPTYTPNQPLGEDGLFIDPFTGVLSGEPPIVGQFMIGICVEEYRNGNYLGTVRQDMVISVTPCTPFLDAAIDATEMDEEGKPIYQLCNENTLTIQNLSGPSGSITDYEWYIDYPDQPLTSNLETPTFTFDQPGVFYGHLVVNPDSLCNDTAFFLVEVSSLDADFLMAYDTCNAGPVDFIAAPISSAMVENYRWDFGDSLTTDEANPAHQYPDAGIYSVQLIVEDEFQCRDTLVQDLTWRPAPEVILVSPDIAVGCTPLTTTIQNRSRPIDTTYQLYWEFGDGGTDTGLAPSHIYRNSGNYNVYLSITSPLGCFVDTIFEDLIFADLPPQADFNWSPSADPENFTEFQFMDASERALGWNWIFDTLSIPDIRPASTYVFSDTGSHEVTLIVEDQYGCFDTLTQSVGVVPLQTYFLPNAFTPNGDGLNDEFIGVGLTDYLADFRLDIFNRFGGLVFSSEDVRQGWDGGNAPAGVYVYKVRYRVPRGERTEMRGEVVLVR